MQVKELGHLVLYVADLERSAAFYGDVLGWEVAFPSRAGHPGGRLHLGRTHHELLLIEVGRTPPRPRAAAGSGSTTSA